MALAGTDFQHHVTFVKAAENYRRAFVKKMNKDMEINHKPGIAYSDYNVGEEMWASIEPFQFNTPSAGSILSSQWRSIVALDCWLAVLFLIVIIYSSKIPQL